MTFKKFMLQGILPLGLFLLLVVCGKCLYMVDGQVDWFRACLVFGIPYGIPYMIWVIPIGGSVTTSIGVLALNCVIGAVFGCFIAVFAVVRAVYYVIGYPVHKVLRR